MKSSLPPKRRSIALAALIFLALAVPTVGIGAWSYASFNQTLTDQIFSHVQTLQALAAQAVALRLDKLVKLADAYAAEPALQDAIADGAWSRGVSVVQTLWEDSPSFYDHDIDRIFLISPNGTINATFPGIEAGIGTIDAGYATWSDPLLRDHAPRYISNVVLRGVSPRINVIKILVPVSKGSSTIGILRFDIPIGEFSDLGKNVDLSANGFAYFTDITGHVIAHPKISSDEPIVNFASVTSVDQAIHGQSGVATLYNTIEQQERVTAYGQVPGYGWVVITQEPLDEAFGIRDGILNRILMSVIALLLLEAGMVIAIFFVKKIRAKRTPA